MQQFNDREEMTSSNLIFFLIVMLIVMMVLGVSGFEFYKREMRLLGGFMGILALISFLLIVCAVLFLCWTWFYYATGGH
jgi:hypothetical protein